MTFSGKMWLMIKLKVTKKQAFILSLKDIYFEKPQGGQIDPPAVLGLRPSKKVIYDSPSRFRVKTFQKSHLIL